MNNPPTNGSQVAAEDLRTLVAGIFARVPIPEDHARLIAELLVDTDLRGVISHGVLQVDRYVRSYQEGKTNTHPEVRVLQEGQVTAALSGDGGLGMIVGSTAMRMAVDKARELGVGIATSTYNDHIGSAGKYVRMALRQNMIGICFSGRNAAPTYDPESTIRGSIQGSPPLAFGMPSGPDHPPFMLDMSSGLSISEEHFETMPQIFFKSIGISHVGNIMSGTLGGQMLPEFERDKIQYTNANQSGFYMALDIKRFVPLPAFQGDMDHLMDEVSKMKPFPGYTASDLPGGPEWKREKEYARNGVPITAEAAKTLEVLAGEFDLSVPW